MIECSPLVFGRVAQWQSIGLLSRWLRVRISPRSSKSSRLGGFLVASPHSGDGIRIFRAHTQLLLRGEFLVASPHSGDDIRIFAKDPAGSALIQIILCRRVFRRSCISVRFFNYPHKYIHHFRIEVISCFRADVFQRLLRGPGAAIGAVGSQCIKNVRHCKDAGR